MKDLALAVAFCAFVLAAAWAISDGLKPNCPAYSTPKLTRSGWYCTVPPL
jgi:hypothetical protein